MKKKILSILSIVSLMTIVGCSKAEPISTSTTSEEISYSEESTISEEESKSSSDEDISSTSSSSEEETTSSSSSSQSESSISSDEEEESKWEDDKYYLECGYYNMSIPSNKDNPINIKTTLSADSSSWFNSSFVSDVSNGYRYIYKNSCSDGPTGHKCSVPTYAESHGGGLKITDPGTGFGSPMFIHEGNKLEIRIGISSVNNASDKPVKGKDTFHIYFFDKNNNYLGKVIREEGTITTSTTEMKFYYTEANAKDVAFFEFRCNAKAYKNSQSYNVGISYCNIKSWERV